MRRGWMHRAVALALLAVCVAGGSARANVEMLTEHETELQRRLLDLWWAEPLTPEHTATVLEALESKKSAVVIEGLRLVAIHDLAVAAPKVRDIAANHPYAAERAFAVVVAQAIGRDGGPESALRARLADPLEGDDYWRGARGEMKSFGYVRAMLSQALVVREARLLRAGRKDEADVLSVPGLDVENFERQLLAFSRLAESDAVRQVLDRLQRATVLGSEEFDHVAVLRTYRAPARVEVLRRLEARATLRSMSGYGKTALLGFMQDEIPDLTPSERTRLRSIVSRMKNDAFNPLARTAVTIERLISQRQR